MRSWISEDTEPYIFTFIQQGGVIDQNDVCTGYNIEFLDIKEQGKISENIPA